MKKVGFGFLHSMPETIVLLSIFEIEVEYPLLSRYIILFKNKITR